MNDPHATNETMNVVFDYPGALGTDVAVVGDFNNWDATTHPMIPVSSGFALTVNLPVGRCYRYRYLIDGQRWDNDWDADGYVVNPYGSDDSLLDLRDASHRYQQNSPDDQPAVQHTDAITADLIEQAVDVEGSKS